MTKPSQSAVSPVYFCAKPRCLAWPAWPPGLCLGPWRCRERPSTASALGPLGPCPCSLIAEWSARSPSQLQLGIGLVTLLFIRLPCKLAAKSPERFFVSGLGSKPCMTVCLLSLSFSRIADSAVQATEHAEMLSQATHHSPVRAASESRPLSIRKRRQSREAVE